MTSEETVTPERMNAFSDAVFAVIITILVLKLCPPKEASFGALLELWPTAVSYAISYLFIAIVWLNHHHLLRRAIFRIYAIGAKRRQFCALGRNHRLAVCFALLHASVAMSVLPSL